jgi:iron-sulfur cluster assembly accessory protein
MTEQTLQGPVTKDLLIGEVVSKYPDIADVFLSYGLHCVGCHVNAFETIEQGAMGHGMSAEEVDEMVAEANNYLAQLTQNADKIIVTPKAVEMLKTLSAEEGKQGWGLRMEAIGNCCSKKTYNLDFEEKPREGDQIIDEGFPLYIAPDSISAFLGATLDYVSSTNGSGFTIKNSQAKSGCGCGGHKHEHHEHGSGEGCGH